MFIVTVQVVEPVTATLRADGTTTAAVTAPGETGECRVGDDRGCRSRHDLDRQRLICRRR